MYVTESVRKIRPNSPDEAIDEIHDDLKETVMN